MCGIYGLIGFSKTNLKQVKKMSGAIAHRGPDDEGLFYDSHIIYGHRRLSIIDISPISSQPMHSPDGRLTIIYNGEVYNYKNIRKTLIDKGYKFLTESDTEVVLLAFHYWGVKSFSKFNGIFSFSIYDRYHKKAYLVRDHFGIKPLYYSLINDSILFCSELRGFEEFDSTWQKNEHWDIQFLTFGFIPEPYTLLDNVFLLEKGACVEYDINSKISVVYPYADYDYDYDYDNIESETQIIENVRSYVVNAVKRNMISDAPIGIFLSGGIDSSLIALIADKLKLSELTTLSINFNESEYDESVYQQIVLDKMSHHNHINYRVNSSDFFSNIDDIFMSMDQPTCDGVNTYFISKAANECGLKVVLSGIGADEIFGGYPSFSRIGYISALKNLPNNLLRSIGMLSIDKLSRLSYLGINSDYKEYLSLRSLFNVNQISSLLRINKNDVIDVLSTLQLNHQPCKIDKNYASYIESNIYMKNQLLRDSDVMGMWNSLEIRVPFLDKELLDYTSKISPSIKYKSKSVKYLLTSAFKDMLPERVVNRKKQGFTFPLHWWIINNREYFSDILSGSHGASEMFDHFMRGKLHWSKIWALIVYNKFKEN